MEKTTPSELIKSIEIQNLFDIFNYHIEYPTKENVLIITGPNGFGKTQVLNIIYNLFNRKFSFFQKLVFEKIKISLSNEIIIEIIKSDDLNSRYTDINDILLTKENLKNKNVNIKFSKNGDLVEDFKYSLNLNEKLIRTLDHYLPISRITDDKWLDYATDEILEIEDVLSRYEDSLPVESGKNISKIQTEKAKQILDSISVHLIKEQRLLKKVPHTDRNYRNERDKTIMIETIQTYANELKNLILEKSQRSFSISQTLDSTYPSRLINENNRVSKEDYDYRFEKLIEKQDKLTKNGLYKTQLEVLNYSADDSKALLVYLDDLEKKLAVFDDFLEKLELFTNILNDRRFTFKSIAIDKDKGFFFKTTKDKVLELNELSSGEQHEVVLLYELIFKTEPGIIVLIDEPELSLHITWQKEFLDDLLRIIKMQNFQVLIATHSPSIINDRWDLVYNLEKR